jgi:hypothetical protein
VAGTIAGAEVADELVRWGRWHWARIAMGVGALIASVIAVGGVAGGRER